MTSNGALHGIRVLDLCDHRGEMAGRVLADLGAEVVCIEPANGSDSRRRGPFAKDGRSLWWSTFALGKKSVVLDLDSPSERTQFLQLVDSCDVCLESFQPGYLQERQLDYAALSTRNPALVMASITPFGQTGPRANDAATDLTLEAAGGLVGMQGDPDRPPLPVGMPQASLHAGVQAAADVLIALNARRQIGVGQHLDVSTQSAVVWTLMNATGWPAVNNRNPPGFCDTRELPRAMPVAGMRAPRLFRCLDGYATFGAHLPGVGERTVAGAMHWLAEAHTDLLDEELTSVDWSRWMQLVQEGKLPIATFNRAFDTIAEAFKRCSKAELLALAVARKLLIAPVLNTADLFEDEQLATRDFWQQVDNLTFAGPFARLSKTPVVYRSPAPELGADQAILKQPRNQPPTRSRRVPETQSFAGLKVADFAWVGVGPIISKAFADHGAEVIHIESSKRLDVLRTIGPFKDQQPGINRSQFFNNFNTNKQSIDLDFKDPADLKVATAIADWADVIVESFVPGTMARYGLDHATLSSRHPELIMLSTCMRGQTGPHNSYGGFGNQGAALAGLFSVTGWPDRPPIGPWGAYTDFIAPRFGVSAIAAALLHRDRTGEGQYIDLSQIEAGIGFLGPLIAANRDHGLLIENPGMASPYACPQGVFAMAEANSYIAIAVATDAQWAALVGLLGTGNAEWNATQRQAHQESIELSINNWCSKLDAASAEQLLQARQVPASRVLWPTQLVEDPQLQHREFFQPLDHPVTGVTNYDGHVTKFNRTPAQLNSAAPTLGQHSDAIRKRFG